MEMWKGKPADYSSLHVFGCPMYVMYNSQERTKLEPKSRKCIFLGYADNVKGYLLWDPTAHKIIVSRDVVFAEKLESEQKNDNTPTDITSVQIEEKSKDNDSSKAEPEHDEQESNEVNDENVRRTTRQMKKPENSFYHIKKI
ncbi:hypothetical protein V8G54_036430 [Vigna mungo]|uniref:Retroviral polymerase SH3-like domain-containing protein n=1 Tax=Vigna mungo TaxID=3915 RepID=A0AAQ3MGQ7_VIGMU